MLAETELKGSPKKERISENSNVVFSWKFLHNLLELSQSLLLQGKSTEQVLEVMMPS